MQIDFCLPIKNEEEILESNLLELFNFLDQANYTFDWKIVGLINNSSDQSELICQQLKERFPNKIDYIIISGFGKGGAIKSYWRQSKADVLAFMDADLAVSLNHIDDLIAPIISGSAELTVGSRFVSGATVNRSIKRQITSWAYVNISKLIIPHQTKDLQCGFKAINKFSFQKIDKFLIDDYWFFDTELILLAEMAKINIGEVAVNWNEKRDGAKKSKIHIFKDGYLFIKKLFIFKKTLTVIKNQLK